MTLAGEPNLKEQRTNGAINILHVDDSRDYLLLAKARLQRLAEDLNIDWAISGEEALKAMESNRYNCVICDYQMPDMDGLKLLETLRDMGDETPFIFLSSWDDDRIVSDAKNSGAKDYVTKGTNGEYFSRVLNGIQEIVNNGAKEVGK